MTYQNRTGTKPSVRSKVLDWTAGPSPWLWCRLSHLTFLIANHQPSKNTSYSPKFDLATRKPQAQKCWCRRAKLRTLIIFPAKKSYYRQRKKRQQKLPCAEAFGGRVPKRVSSTTWTVKYRKHWDNLGGKPQKFCAAKFRGGWKGEARTVVNVLY